MWCRGWPGFAWNPGENSEIIIMKFPDQITGVSSSNAKPREIETLQLYIHIYATSVDKYFSKGLSTNDVAATNNQWPLKKMTKKHHQKR